MRKVKPAVLAAIFAVIIVVIIVAGILVNKFAPTDEVMDLNKYYEVNEDEAVIIFQDGLHDKKALIEEDTFYVDYETVVNSVNKRFYLDSKENLLLYTTPTELIRTEIGSKEYSSNKNSEETNYPLTKTKDGILYIDIEFIKNYSDIEYEFYESPNRLIIKKGGGEYLFATTKKASQLRVSDSVKSEILVELEEGVELQYVDNEEIYENNFSKVMTSNGIVGFVRDKHISDSYYKKTESTFQPPEYVQTKRQEPLNVVWHQVTNQDANNNVLTELEGTKGVTTISPTWYSISGEDGTITSLASETYVERVHGQGIEVWALVDDFNPEVNIGEVLSYTSRREKLINELIAEAIRYNLDGLNIDFETVPQEGGIHFIQFLRELSIKCRSNGIVLSVDNYVPREYSAYYDLEEQGVIVDYVIIMAYDEHHSTSDVSGSVSSIGFVQDGIERTLAMIPKEKVIIGIPFFTRLWKEDDSGVVESQALAMSNAEKTFEVNGVTPEWDNEVGQYYGEYEAEGFTYRMWLEEEESIDLKMQAIKEADVAGVAQWKLGLEKKSIWNVINKYLN